MLARQVFCHLSHDSSPKILFFSLPSLVSSNSTTFRNMFCVYLYVYIIMLMFVLDVSSTYKRKHATFVFLNLANFT
jgi:hypothetical protein